MPVRTYFAYVSTLLYAGHIKEWKEKKIPSVWLHVPITLSHLITGMSSLGFVFHHARQRQAVLNLWLDSNKPSKIPLYGTHQVGVAGKYNKLSSAMVHHICRCCVQGRE